MIDTIEPEVKKRALRRHHNERMKVRTRKMFSRWGHTEKEMEGSIDRCYNNITRCSCYMCGNPRKYGELSFQERKGKWSETDYWQEDLADEWHWDLLDSKEYGGYDWCLLCDREFVGVCSCGYRPNHYIF